MFSVTLQKTELPGISKGLSGEMVIIQRVGIYSKAMVVGDGEVNKDLGVGEEDLVGKLLLKKILLVGGSCFDAVLVSASTTT